jgi:FkbM family methyltransferase
MWYKYIREIIKKLIPRKLYPVSFRLSHLARLSRNRQTILGKHAIAILTQGYNGCLLVPASDMEVGKALACDGFYNRNEIEYHLSNLSASSQVLFVGAHVGSLLVPIAKRVKRVVGIEANPRTFSLLEYNVCLNKLKNVELYNIAAGNKDGTIELLMHSHNTGASKIKLGNVNENDVVFGYDRPELALVQMKRLDELLGRQVFDLIIMDVEGSEYLALQGMSDILASAGSLQLELVPFLLSQYSVDIVKIIELLKPNFDYAWDLSDAFEGKPAQNFDVLAKLIANNFQLIDIYLEKDKLAR